MPDVDYNRSNKLYISHAPTGVTPASEFLYQETFKAEFLWPG